MIRWLRKRPLLTALLLGPLTFVVTPLVGLLIAMPVLLLSRVSERFHPIFSIARLLHLEELAGYFAGAIIFVGIIAVVGDVATGVLAGVMLKSRRWALVTFVTALVCQGALLGVQTTRPFHQEPISAEADWTMEFKDHAEVGEIRAEAEIPYGDIVFNPNEELGPIYGRITLTAPITVRHAGRYQVSVSYECQTPDSERSGYSIDSIRTFPAGSFNATTDLRTNMPPWYWTPRATGGTAVIRLEYMATRRDRDDAMKATMTPRGWKQMEDFLKRENPPDTTSRAVPVTVRTTVYPGGQRFKPKPRRRYPGLPDWEGAGPPPARYPPASRFMVLTPSQEAPGP